MPLSQNQLAILRNVCNQNPGGTTVSIDLATRGLLVPANECACWRWAATGLGGAVNDDPAQMFTAIAVGAALNNGSAWANTPAAQAFATNKHNEYNQYVNSNYQAVDNVSWEVWFGRVVDSIATNMCDLGGMQVGNGGPSANGARYYVQMHYERSQQIARADGTSEVILNAPNYTHWWIRIELGSGQYCCIEMFPQSTVLTFRINNAYATDDNSTVEVVDLHPNHLQVLGVCLP